tara:strand:- start:56 stop:286 length:231 start_codon:yes stop_codon:yes gene_type:complete
VALPGVADYAFGLSSVGPIDISLSIYSHIFYSKIQEHIFSYFSLPYMLYIGNRKICLSFFKNNSKKTIVTNKELNI